jgi:hypothetical protein
VQEEGSNSKARAVAEGIVMKYLYKDVVVENVDVENR